MRVIVIEKWKKSIKKNNKNNIKNRYKQFKIIIFIKNKSNK